VHQDITIDLNQRACEIIDMLNFAWAYPDEIEFAKDEEFPGYYGSDEENEINWDSYRL